MDLTEITTSSEIVPYHENPYTLKTIKDSVQEMKINKRPEDVYDLTIADILNADTNRDRIMELKYSEILNRCLSKVVKAYNQGRNNYTTYKVPASVQGLRRYYDPVDCIVFLINQLREVRWIDVKFLPPNRLFIWWTNEERNLKKLSNRIFVEKEYRDTKRIFEKQIDVKIHTKTKPRPQTSQPQPEPSPPPPVRQYTSFIKTRDPEKKPVRRLEFKL